MIDCPTHGSESLEAFCYELRDEHRTRIRWQRAQTKLTLQARAHCRSMVGASLAAQGVDTTDADEQQLKALNTAADALYRAVLLTLNGKGHGSRDIQVVVADADELAGGGQPLVDILILAAPTRLKKQPARPSAELVARTARRIAPYLLAREQMHRPLLHQSRIVEKLALLLPVAPWAKSVRGLGIPSLGAIVGEATGNYGTIDCYRNPNALWKRMGVGVVEGERQRKTTNAELAIAMGYDAERHALMWGVAENLVKGNYTADRQDGPYRLVYLAEKERQALLHPELTLAHRNERAKRYMAKRLLKDLWREWTGRGVEWAAA